MNSCESSYNNIVSIIKNTKHNNIDTLTFLKSNYKYKRRFDECMSEQLPLATEMLQKKNVKECKRGSSNSNISRHATMSATVPAVKSKSHILLTFRIILRLFIAIVGNFIKYIKTTNTTTTATATSDNCLHDYQNNVADDIVADVDSDGDVVNDVGSSSSSTFDDDVYNSDSDEIYYQQNYDKASNENVLQQPPRYNKNSKSISRCQLHLDRHHQAIKLWRWRQLGNLSGAALNDFSMYSSSSLMSAIASARRSPMVVNSVSRHYRRSLCCFNSLSIILTLIISLAALRVRSVEAGECWLQTLDNGNCNKIFSRNLSKAECCSTDQEFSYTDRDLTSVEYFFATSIGEGVKCAPCIESCKNVQCGLNKKCVKRNGRPKCICAPECGAAMRRKQQQEQQQQQKRGKLFRGHKHHNEQIRGGVGGGREGSVNAGMIFEKSPRDIRSLSSEITNINLGLDGVMRHANQNQRKQIIIMQQSQQSQQKPHKIKREPKPGRGLTTANVEQSVEALEKPTASTRRLQILSNVGIRNSGNGNGGNSNRKGNGGNGRRNKDDSTKITTSSSSMETTRRGSIMSRHKLDNEHKNNHKNKNKKKTNTNELELNRNQQQLENDNKKVEETEIHEATHSNENSNNDARFRHIHQNVKIHEVVNDEVVANNKHHQHHHQRQHEHHHAEFPRKRKHHNNNGSHQRSKQKKLHKDQQLNANNSTRTTPTATTITPASSSETNSASSKTSSSLSATNKNTTATLYATTFAAPVNSMSSASTADADQEHRLLNHGSNSATSSSSSLTTAAAAAEGVSAHRHRAGDKDGSNSIHSNDLTSLEGIYDKFNFHGFPKQQHEITQFENLQHAPHPVCGTDGRAYTTECQLRKRACRTDNPTLQVAYRGHCKTTCNGVKCLNGLTCVEDHYRIPHCIACRIDCPEDHRDGNGDDDNDDHSSSNVIDPVCGVDGKTYRSICDINRMICKIGRSIAVAYPGRCRADRVTCNDIICGSKHTCLVDLLTHEPRCVSCRYKCSRKRRPPSLRFEEGKICGVNNHTYNSWCEMRKDSCTTGFFIDVKSPGEC